MDVEGLPGAVVEVLRGDVAGLRVQTYAQMLKRPEVTVEGLWPVLRGLMENVAELRAWLAKPGEIPPDMGHPKDRKLAAWVRNEMKTVETEIKYAGYLEQQRRSMDEAEAGGGAGDSGVVRLHGVQRAEPRDGGDAGAGAAADAGAGEPDSGSDAGGGESGELLYRDSGEEAGCSGQWLVVSKSKDKCKSDHGVSRILAD